MLRSDDNLMYSEENNRMGKTRDLFKKIKDTKGTFHAKMGSIKDRNGMDLTEAEEVARIHRTDAFELWCWRRLLRVAWTARRSNQSKKSVLNIHWKLKLKLQYFGHLMGKNRLTGKDPDAGTDRRQEKKGMTEDDTVGWHH